MATKGGHVSDTAFSSSSCRAMNLEVGEGEKPPFLVPGGRRCHPQGSTSGVGDQNRRQHFRTFCWFSAVICVVFFLGSLFYDSVNVRNHLSAAEDVEEKEKKALATKINSTDAVREIDQGSENAVGSGPEAGHADGGSVNVKQEVELPPGYKKPASYYSDTYLPRGPTLNDTQRRSLADTWGSWTFQDPNPDVRPRGDFYSAYPNRDVPFADFPQTAWQRDPAYLEGFLKEGLALVDRALETILAEYGHSQADEPNKTFEERSAMFHLREYAPDARAPSRRQVFNDGGWTTAASWKMFVKRILHAVMTEDNFVFVMGGHSSAAGHGNHFQQSYTLQLQQHLEPVMARLGVTFTARNFGMGGLGTIHNALGMGDLYGKDIDILRWDSSMTEGVAGEDLFQRQGLVSGNKVPALWGGSFGTLQRYHLETGIEVFSTGQWGECRSGIPVTEDPVKVKDLPFAAQYLQCSKEMTKICSEIEHRYNGVCWIDRDDVVAPKPAKMGSRVKWHPGNREHALHGKVLAFTMLRAIKRGFQQWNNATEYQLPDDAWHLTEHYESVRSKMRLMANDTACFQLGLPDYVCRHPLHARSEYTPRYNPAATSIRSMLLPPAGTGVYARLKPRPNYYDPPDVHNPAILDVPEGAVDYMAIVENGIGFSPNRFRPRVFEPPQWQSPQRRRAMSVSSFSLAGKQAPDSLRRRRLAGFSAAGDGDTITPGSGWYLDAPGAADNCDGTYDSFCARQADSPCMLYGHNDFRGGLDFDGYAGWLVMGLEEVRRGLIIVRIESWHKAGTNPVTKDWSCENNRDCAAVAATAKLGGIKGGNNSTNGTDAGDESVVKKLPDCEERWRFQFAINGVITEWNWDEFNRRKTGVHIFVLMDDPNFAASVAVGGGDGDGGFVELAIRLTGCRPEETNVLRLSHVYWA